MKKYLAINGCPVHKYTCVTIDDEDGSGYRLVGSKCCGRREQERRWEITPQVREALLRELTLMAEPSPVDMILHCPACRVQHIDAPETGGGAFAPGAVGYKPSKVTWANPPHRSHLCHNCGHIWRPADAPTNGVATIKTAGKADSPLADGVPT